MSYIYKYSVSNFKFCIMNPYHEYLNKISPISEDTFNRFVKLCERKTVVANTILAEAGKMPNKIYLLISGVLRAYITTEEGKDYNKRIYSPISFGGALTSLIKKEPSKITFESLTECDLFEIDYYGAMQLCDELEDAPKLYTRILEKAFIAYEDRNIDLMTLNGTQRYQKLLKQIPNIEELIPQYQIASYLNVSPVQLSRIRKKLL